MGGFNGVLSYSWSSSSVTIFPKFLVSFIRESIGLAKIDQSSCKTFDIYTVQKRKIANRKFQSEKLAQTNKGKNKPKPVEIGPKWKFTNNA